MYLSTCMHGCVHNVIDTLKKIDTLCTYTGFKYYNTAIR